MTAYWGKGCRYGPVIHVDPCFSFFLFVCFCGFFMPRMMFNLIVSVSSISIAMDLNETFFLKKANCTLYSQARQTGRNSSFFLFMRWMAPQAATTEPNSVLVDLRSQRSETTGSSLLRQVTWDRKVACFLTLTLRRVMQPMTFALLSW